MSLKFYYKAKNESGEDKNGTIEALDEKDAVKQLQSQGLYVISISSINVCPKCGKKYDSSWKVCLDCGVAFEKEVINKTLTPPNTTATLTKCKTCNKEVSVNAATCPHCGEDLSGTRVKCLRCGSTSITSAKKGFSIGALFGGLCLAPILMCVLGVIGLFLAILLGLFLGALGGGIVVLYCQACGRRWEPTLKEPLTSAGVK